MTAEELKKIPLLSNIDDNVIRKFFKESKISTRHYTKGITVHNQQDDCISLEVVLAGPLVAYSLAENGSSIAMFEFGENSIIGANLLFGDDHAYPLNIYCGKSCQLLQIKKEAVLEFLHD
jgi:CRP-like cAMP-binding protein